MSSGMNYAPRGKQRKVIEAGRFGFAAVGLDHGHIYGMCHGLVDAGADILAVYDPDPAKVAEFRQQFPQAVSAASLEEVLENPRIDLVASAAVPADRGPIGLKVQAAGKHYFSDKAPFTSLDQLDAARESVSRTGKKWAVCYSERLQNESAVYAGKLIKEGAIGRVLQVIGMGPHRLQAEKRPDWFFKKERYGGILNDIGSHQIEQFLYFAGAEEANILSARVANHNHPEYPELEDFGEAHLLGNNGASCFLRVDWFTPDGLSTWGDGRTFVLGTEGYIELRKYLNVAADTTGDHVFLVNHEGEQHIPVHGQVGFPYFGELILDCLNGTETAMSQAHAFKAAEITLRMQAAADSGSN